MRIQIKVTLPKKQFSNVLVQHYLHQKQKSVTGPEIKQDFEGTVQGWNNKPAFITKYSMNDREVGVRVYPSSGKNGDIYRLVVLGSPAHTITVRRAPFLRYQTGYSSSTKAGSLLSRPNQRSGRWRVAHSVKHPGFEEREFDRLIGDKNLPKFQKDMQDAVEEAFRHM